MSISGVSANPTWPPTSPISRETPYAHRAPNASEIFPRLYVSDLAFAENPTLLRSLGITHVLSAMCGHVAVPRSILVQHLQCDLEDLPFAELVDRLPVTTMFLRDALRDPSARVLVHCVEGVSRSTSVVCAYLIAEYGYEPSQAIQYVKSRRRSAEPNFGFVQQLHEYAAKLRR
ncbi:phosphotyrosine protein [Scleroderma citrinum]